MLWFCTLAKFSYMWPKNSSIEVWDLCECNCFVCWDDECTGYSEPLFLDVLPESNTETHWDELVGLFAHNHSPSLVSLQQNHLFIPQILLVSASKRPLIVLRANHSSGNRHICTFRQNTSRLCLVRHSITKFPVFAVWVFGWELWSRVMCWCQSTQTRELSWLDTKLTSPIYQLGSFSTLRVRCLSEIFLCGTSFSLVRVRKLHLRPTSKWSSILVHSLGESHQKFCVEEESSHSKSGKVDPLLCHLPSGEGRVGLWAGYD